MTQPTRVRYTVIGLTTLMAVILYLDRFSLSFLEPFIREDLGYTENQANWLLSAFFLSYAIAQVPSGWLSDRFGARVILTWYIVLWSLFTGLMGLAFSFALVVVCRLGVGLAQAGAYPTAAAMISKWVPFTARATASSIVATGGRIGGALAPVLSAYLLIAFLPTDLPSQFTTTDLLRPGEFFLAVHQTKKSDKPSPSDRLTARLRTELPASPAAGSDQGRQEAVQVLNRFLTDPEMTTYLELENIALSAHAKRLIALPVGDLSPSDRERLNRYLLEAAYPDHLRKLEGVGWRKVTIVFGLAGILVGLIFWWGVRNWPREHPRVNEAEVLRIEEGRPPGASSPHGKVGSLPFRYILQSRSLWLNSLNQWGTNIGWVFLVTLLPRYLDDVHDVPVVRRGWMAGLPIFVGLFGMMLGGWLTDRLTRAYGVKWGRRLPMALTRFLAMVGYLGVLVVVSTLEPGENTAWLAVLALCLVAFGTDLGSSSNWAFMQDVGGRHVGSILGWGNMWGNFGAFMSPLLMGWTVRQVGWDGGFWTGAAAFFIAGVAALGVDATVPVVPPEKKPPI